MFFKPNPLAAAVGALLCAGFAHTLHAQETPSNPEQSGQEQAKEGEAEMDEHSGAKA